MRWQSRIEATRVSQWSPTYRLAKVVIDQSVTQIIVIVEEAVIVLRCVALLYHACFVSCALAASCASVVYVELCKRFEFSL
jgi:hypothetical protein